MTYTAKACEYVRSGSYPTLDTLYDELIKDKISLDILSCLFDKFDNDEYYEFEFICYNIPKGKMQETIETVKNVFKGFIKGFYLDAEPLIYANSCYFFISNHDYKDGYSIKEAVWWEMISLW